MLWEDPASCGAATSGQVVLNNIRMKADQPVSSTPQSLHRFLPWVPIPTALNDGIVIPRTIEPFPPTFLLDHSNRNPRTAVWIHCSCFFLELFYVHIFEVLWVEPRVRSTLVTPLTFWVGWRVDGLFHCCILHNILFPFASHFPIS